jgi:hypothetical protein
MGLLLIVLIACGGLPLLVYAGLWLLLWVATGCLFSVAWAVFLLYGPGWFLTCLAVPVIISIGVYEWRHGGD